MERIHYLFPKLEQQQTQQIFNTITHTYNVVSLNLHGIVKPTTMTIMKQHSNLHTYNAHGKDLNAQEYKVNLMENLFI